MRNLDGHAGDGLLDAARGLRACERVPEALWTARAADGRLLALRGARGRPGSRQCRVVADRRAQHGERARGDRRRAPRRRAGGAGASRRSRTFQGIARRMQLRGEVHGVRVYDDFAHHPTAIATTLDGLRRRVGKAAHRRGARAALEHHADGRAPRHARPLARAARTRCGCTRRRTWAGTPAPVMSALGARGHVSRDIEALAARARRSPAPRRSRARS